jgi:hypothetical protein
VDGVRINIGVNLKNVLIPKARHRFEVIVPFATKFKKMAVAFATITPLLKF